RAVKIDWCILLPTSSYSAPILPRCSSRMECCARGYSVLVVEYITSISVNIFRRLVQCGVSCAWIFRWSVVGWLSR
ncbi:MAG: hypothetical protein QXF17_04720, partial [Ignisphaera sp.]